MKFDDVVDVVRAHDDGTGAIWIRNGKVDLDYIVQATIKALGIEIATDGTVAVRPRSAWEPPGGLVRPKRVYKNGRGPKK